MSTRLTILYTADLRGDEAALTHLLPRLYTFIRDMRKDVQLNDPIDRLLLLDLGGSCAPDVWPCSATGGRSTLIVLDAMGYHAANATHLAPDSRARLETNMLQMALVDEAHDWQHEDILVTCRGGSETLPYESIQLHILLAPAESTRLEHGRLSLAAIQRGQVGRVRLIRGDPPALEQHAVFNLAPSTPPDPTITAAAEFVLGEARLYQRKK